MSCSESHEDLLVLVINLDDSQERMREADTQLSDVGIDYTRFSAVDGRGKKANAFLGYDEKSANNFYGRRLTGGEVGCFLSHVRCAQAFLKTQAKYCLVLEDDIQVLPNAKGKLTQLISWLAKNEALEWDLINLRKQPRRFFSVLDKFSSGNSCTELAKAHYFPVSTAALLWSRPGAQRFAQTQDHVYAPIDHFLRFRLSASGRGLITNPPIFGVTGAESVLDNDRKTGPTPNRALRGPAHIWIDFKRQGSNYLNAIYHLLRHRLFGR